MSNSGDLVPATVLEGPGVSRPRLTVVVDGYGAGADLARELNHYGRRCVHVQSTPEVPPDHALGHHPELWRHTLVYDGALEALVRRLQALGHVDAVAIGAHEGIWLADALSEALGLPNNGPAARRLHLDKQLAAEALSEAGVAGPATLPATTPQEALDAARQLGAWPVVVKPINSAGSDGVRFCRSPRDVERASKELLGAVNRLGQLNHKLAVQEFIQGPAYATHTISVDGDHALVAALEFVKRPSALGADLYDCFKLVCPSRRGLWRTLATYSTEALDALGLRTGPALGEVMLTASGPMLVELNARLAGAGTGSRREVRRALGHSQASAYALQLIDPLSFAERVRLPDQLRAEVWFVALASLRAGVVADTSKLERARSLKSFSDFVWRPSIGDRLEPSVDQMSLPALAVLSDPELEVVQRDYATLRRWESEGLFGLEERT